MGKFECKIHQSIDVCIMSRLKLKPKYINLIKLASYRDEYIIVSGSEDILSTYISAMSKRKPIVVSINELSYEDHEIAWSAIKLRLKYRNCVPVTTDSGLNLEDGYWGSDIEAKVAKIIELSKERFYIPMHNSCGTHSHALMYKYSAYEINKMIPSHLGQS